MFCVWLCQTRSASTRKVQVVSPPGRKTRFVCAVFVFLLVSTLGALSASNTPSRGVVLSVAAQTAPATSNTTVSNTVTVLSDRLSFGSVLYVEGVVATPQGPLAFVPVTLHVGGATIARTQTNESGAYTFSVPVGLILPEAFSGSASVYTVAEPGNPALPATSSAVASVPVSQVPAYLIVAVVTGAVVLGIYVHARPCPARRVSVRGRLAATREWFPSRASGAGSNVDESTEYLAPVPTAEQPRLDDSLLVAEERAEAPAQQVLVPETELALEKAYDLFDQGKDQPAVGLLYVTTVTCLAKTHGVTLSPSMTPREKYATLREAAPEERGPLRTLTAAYEHTAYAGRPLTEEQRNAAIEACNAICKRLRE